MKVDITHIAKLTEYISKHLRIYDNGGKTLDRYTVIFMTENENQPNTYGAIGMSCDPYGTFGQHCTAMPGRHLGKRIKLQDLPISCQEFTISDIIEIIR